MVGMKFDFLNLKNSIADLTRLSQPPKHPTMKTLGKS